MSESLIKFLCTILQKLPFEIFEFSFMQMAMLAVLFITPMTAAAGVQVINCRMAFFADAVSHSAFAGAALGILFFGAAAPLWTMPLLAVLIAIGVMYLKKSSKLSTDTVIGLFFAFVLSAGLLLLSRQPSLARLSQMFVFGDILTVDHRDLTVLLVLNIIYLIFISLSCNALQLIAVDEDLAAASGVKISLYNCLNIVLLALIVILSIKALGVLLISAMLIVPAAAARNLARRAGTVYLYAVIIGVVSGVTGLLISAQEWANTAAGATIVMTDCAVFILSLIVKKLRKA